MTPLTTLIFDFHKVISIPNDSTYDSDSDSVASENQPLEAGKTVTTEQRKEQTTNSTHIMVSIKGFETRPRLWEVSTLTAALSIAPFLHWFYFVLQMVTCWDNVCCCTKEKCLHLWQQWYWTPLPKKPPSSEQIRVFTLPFPSCLSGKWSFSKDWQNFLVTFSSSTRY